MVERARRVAGAGLAAVMAHLALTVGAAAADRVERGVVVELFTSQACMYCPPADALLSGLDARDGVIGLSLNVMYWDFYGWRDSLARPEHQARQTAYQMRLGDGQPFTPQIVVQGEASAQGNRQTDVESAVEAATLDDPTIALTRDGRILTIETPAVGGGAPCDIVVIGFDHPQPVDIRGGDNRDKTIVYHNVVREIRHVGAWRGEAARVQTTVEPTLRGYAVLLQEPNVGRIVAAAAITF